MEKVVAFTFLMINVGLFSQENINGVFSPVINPCSGFVSDVYKKPVPYTSIREADVAWEKRIWREIDLREKINQPLYYPIEYNVCRHSLFQVLSENILKGNIIAFADEEFLIPYNNFEVRKKLIKQDSLIRFDVDPLGNTVENKVPVADSTDIFRRVLKYRLKEDWYFDKQKSSLEVRIIGMAAYEWDSDKEAFRELFWVYFPACRTYLATNGVFNFKNDKEQRNMDEVFMKRMFSSTIVKESNVYDRFINEYQKGIDALVESEKIKMDLFTWEHDLWNY